MIKSLRRCPCPWCHVLKNQISDLGTVNDMKCWENIREDNSRQQNKVEKARQGIFTKGYSIVSTAFQNLMGLTSLVPTPASHLKFLHIYIILMTILRMPFLHNSQYLDLTSILCSLQIYYMSLSSEFEKWSLLILSEWCILSGLVLYRLLINSKCISR